MLAWAGLVYKAPNIAHINIAILALGVSSTLLIQNLLLLNSLSSARKKKGVSVYMVHMMC